MPECCEYGECDECGKCDECNENALLFVSETPLGTFQLCQSCSCSVCRLCGKTDTDLVYHHVSYLFDIGLNVCKDCHHTIHHGGGHEELEPTITRSYAKELGINGTLLD